MSGAEAGPGRGGRRSWGFWARPRCAVGGGCGLRRRRTAARLSHGRNCPYRGGPATPVAPRGAGCRARAHQHHGDAARLPQRAALRCRALGRGAGTPARRPAAPGLHPLSRAQVLPAGRPRRPLHRRCRRSRRGDGGASSAAVVGCPHRTAAGNRGRGPGRPERDAPPPAAWHFAPRLVRIVPVSITAGGMA